MCSTSSDTVVLLDDRVVSESDLTAVDVDSIFTMKVLTDSADLAARGQCPADVAILFITAAEARRLGLRPPPPALCMRGVHGVLPAGQTVRFSAGQLDILDECDRPPPPGLSWISSDTTILVVDTTGRVTGIAPGTAEVVVAADTVRARQVLQVVPAIARIRVSIADTVVVVGDTVVVHARAYGLDGRELLDVPLMIFAFTDVQSDGERRIDPWGTELTARLSNSRRLTPRRVGRGWIRTAVIGMADSVAVRVIER